jgi:hypothetical protein
MGRIIIIIKLTTSDIRWEKNNMKIKKWIRN